MRFDEAVKMIEESDFRCMLCGGPPFFVGCWVPNDDALFGKPPEDKGRVMFYRLCEACVNDPASIEAVEDKILAKAKEEAN